MGDPARGHATQEELTYEEVQRIKYELWSTDVDAQFDGAQQGSRIVAEGDSWFDYDPMLDILDHLKGEYGYDIYKVSQAGDTLDNMVYGTEYGRNYSRKTPSIETTLEAIRRYQPPVFLFSGGGNDVAGPELASYLNHKSSGLPAFREDYVSYVFSTVSRKAFSDLIGLVTKANPDIQIISHGYGYAIPDGRAVVRIGGMSFIGPWLRPVLTRKNYIEAGEARALITSLIDRFNEMLEGLDETYDNFHYIDLRQEIQDEDWANELHLYGNAYLRVAGLFDQKIRQLTGN